MFGNKIFITDVRENIKNHLRKKPAYKCRRKILSQGGLMTIKITQPYVGLSRNALLDKANELGYNFTKNSGSCSQSSVAALHELLGFDPMLVKAATSLCGGTAIQHLGTCGALAGGIMVLDYYTGRPPDKMSYREYVEENWDLLRQTFAGPKLLTDRFINKYFNVGFIV